MFVVATWCCFIYGTITHQGFITFLDASCVTFGLDEQWMMVVTFIWLLQVMHCGMPMCCPSIGHFLTWSCKDSLLVAYCKLFIVATWCCFICGTIAHWVLQPFRDAVCEAWIGWIVIDYRNLRLIVANNVLWCAHVSSIYWTFYHLKLQRFTFSGIMQIIYCCHLALFYLWHHYIEGFCNLSCDTMCEVWTICLQVWLIQWNPNPIFEMAFQVKW